MLNVQRIREDFPILTREVHGKPLVYLDNAATTQKPRQVIDALVHYYSYFNANIHRGLHLLSEEGTAAYEASRAHTARFINAPSVDEVIFTRNTTESLNLIAYSLGRQIVGAGDEIVLTQMEHHSNLVPWQILAAEKGATLRFLRIDAEGELMREDFDLIGPRTKIVSAVHMSNVLGAINPVEELARRAHAVGAIMVVDGAQSAPHFPIDVQALGCDFFAFSAHKMLGPTGVGVLWGKRALLEAMPPFLGGGEMITVVQPEFSTWKELPWKFEAGTPNIADVIAFDAALTYLDTLGMANVREHEIDMAREAMTRLNRLEGIQIYGPRDPNKRGAAIAFNYGDIHPHDIGTVLDRHGVAVRAGHHCAQPLMRCLGVAATARASFYIYNTVEEIDALVDGLKDTARIFSLPVKVASS